MSLKDIQREILENKKRHGFNTTNIEKEILKKIEKNKTRQYRMNSLGNPVHDWVLKDFRVYYFGVF